MVIVYAALFVDWRILRMQGNEFPVFMNILLLAAVIIIYLISLYVFPILSRYQNTVTGRSRRRSRCQWSVTIRTIGSAIVYPIPYVILFFVGYPIVPIILCFCFTGPGYFRAKMYDGLFLTYETVAANATKEVDMSDVVDAEEVDPEEPEVPNLPDPGDSESGDA